MILDVRHSIHPTTHILADALRSAANLGVEMNERKLAMAIGGPVDLEAANIIGLGRLPVERRRSRIVFVPHQECDRAMVRADDPQHCAAYLVLYEQIGRLPPLFDLHCGPPVGLAKLWETVNAASYREPWKRSALD